MSKPTVYLETTVIGHLAGRQHTDVVVAARQLLTRDWWDVREDYSVFISQIVVDECSAGDSVAANERLALIRDLAVLEGGTEANELAKSLVRFYGIPKSEPRDSLHIATAAVGGIKYLLTWNFRHIANPSTRSLIEKICNDAGYIPPIICTPDELLGTR